MEPITLCGIVIVAFGLWIEGESLVKRLARSFCRSNLLKRIMALAPSEQKPVFANRYVPYSPH
ncbi:hypothetical protein [Geobacter sp. AOG2]|uniref:hypothetical protein n=1 Tax=Geobacter sp. AOG2 TaxID=1566347 RepID=UPI001CC39578|nr:hypothetical protein [Geobacter sp. AOG2]GFE61834.1 hypothetical protein AOG2_24220 [Geobacter sp. AOG2]